MLRIDIQGAGGKGGGGSSFHEDDDTLRANTMVSTLEAIGLGPIVGPANGLNSFYLNETPLQNAQGEDNFKNVTVQWRTGLPSQDAIKGFETVGAPITVSTNVTFGSPVTRTVSSASVDAVGVTIRLPSGLSNQNTESNALEKTTLELKIETKLTSSGTWGLAQTIRYNDKTTSDYQETFRVERPSGTGTWDFKVTRLTADAAVATLRNASQVAYFTEYQEQTITYPNIAVYGITLDASGVNATAIPKRSAEMYLRIIQVPTNYDARTHTFSGVWDGNFQNSWSDDPAWVIYDIATLPKPIGLGLSEDEIDLVSFYECSQYNNETVTFTGIDDEVYSSQRYSFNFQITQAEQPAALLNRIASAMNGKVMWVNGKLTLVQDRPADFEHVFTNANIEASGFTRSGSPLSTRYTVANVSWNAPKENYGVRVTPVEAEAGDIAAYGLVAANIAAYGCTSMAQAIRYGRQYLYTSLNQTETITFTVGQYGAYVLPNQVIKVYDQDFADQLASGRLIAGSTTTVLKLDREVDISADATIDIIGMDGTLHSEVPIATTGLTDTITLSSALPSAPAEFSTFIITTNGITPELFRVMEVKETAKGQYTITAGTYDENKYAYVEDGVILPKPVYSRLNSKTVSPPTDLVFEERAVTDELSVKRHLQVSWTAPPNEVVAGYYVQYTLNGGTPNVITTRLNFVEGDIEPGEVIVSVQAVSMSNIFSTPLTGTYTVGNTEVSGSTLDPVEDLFVYGTTGTTFIGQDLAVQWTNPASNGDVNAVTAFYKVVVLDDADVELRTEYLPGTIPGTTASGTYTYQMNLDDGGPRRTLKVQVYQVDAEKKLSAVTEATFTNDAPAVPANIDITPIPEGTVLYFDPVTEADLAGYVVWWDYTTGFTPSALTNRTVLGKSNSFTFGALDPATNVYYRVAAFDTFASQTDIDTGSNLNVSIEHSTTTDSSDAPPLLTLQADGFAYVYDTVDASTSASPTITFEAVLANVSGTATFTATAYTAAHASLGTITLGGSGNVRTLTAAQFNSLGATTTRYVKVNATLGALSDTTTVYRGDGGSDTVQAVLSNEAHTLPANSAGTVSSYTGSGTTIRVFQGVTELDYDGVGTAAGKWTVSSSASNITRGSLTDSGLFLTVGNHSAMTANNATITYTISGKDSDGVSFSITKVQSFAKSTAGSDGANGGSIRVVTNSSAVFIPAGSGSTYTPSSIILSRELSGGVTDTSAAGTVWTVTSGTFTGSLSVLHTGTGAFASIEPSEMTTDAVTFKCTVTDTVTGYSYSDQMTVIKSRDTVDGYLSNDSVSLPANTSNAITSYTGADGTFKVVNASGDVSVGSGVIAFSIVGHSGFGTTFPTNTGISIHSTNGTYAVTSNVTSAATQATVTFRATYTDPLGGTKNIDKIFTIGKSQTGATGSTGSTGNTGNSAARAYALYTGNPVTSGGPVTRSGTTLPATNSFSPTSATAFTSTVQTPGTNQSMFQSDGIFDPVANQTVWGTPYLSNWKVGSLEVVSNVVAGGIQINTGGNIYSGKTTSTSTGTAGFFLGNESGTAKLTVGDASLTKALMWDGTNLNLRVNGTSGLNIVNMASGSPVSLGGLFAQTVFSWPATVLASATGTGTVNRVALASTNGVGTGYAFYSASPVGANSSEFSVSAPATGGSTTFRGLNVANTYIGSDTTSGATNLILYAGSGSTTGDVKLLKSSVNYYVTAGIDAGAGGGSAVTVTNVPTGRGTTLKWWKCPVPTSVDASGFIYIPYV